MVKGWVFFWECRYYYVGAPDAPTARTYLRKQYLHVAQHARVPREVTEAVILDLQLKDGIIRVSDSNKVAADVVGRIRGLSPRIFKVVALPAPTDRPSRSQDR